MKDLQINLALEAYRKFLTQNWFLITNTLPAETVGDWMQANWELIVEANICKAGTEFLDIYGDGADCNDDSSRVWFPDANVTHGVFCSLKKVSIDVLSGREIKLDKLLEFEAFCSWDDKHKVYSSSPPLEYVSCYTDETQAVIPLCDVDFVKSTLPRK